MYGCVFEVDEVGYECRGGILRVKFGLGGVR